MLDKEGSLNGIFWASFIMKGKGGWIQERHRLGGVILRNLLQSVEGLDQESILMS